ncbi:MAG: tRNA preQ1(34) S-adenosylmethionine ribosyltransferase-isomerase QueA [Candidatus Aminicenantes bacterium]|nr:MAG: tRNA preQ1(34) S-adenosylmethionine ribosyltransferase-isomerase QueA [Candidatus Aminicenantes bacterium]
MLVADFDYELPAGLIAQKPLPERQQSLMMILHRETGEIIHSRFSEFPAYLQKDDVLVLNTSKVIPARVYGKIEGKEIEFLFLKELGDGLWEVLCRPAKKVRLGDAVVFSDEFEAKIASIGPEGKRTIQFTSGDILPKLKKVGFAPLPPYIKRKSKNSELRAMDIKRYQTVFAEHDGAIAAPTAGLHFTPDILKEIAARGAAIVRITLDVGLATFQPVRVTKIENHQMLEEDYTISPSASRIINSAKKESRPLTAVGTTSVRALESAFQEGKIQPGKGSTRLFIYPGYSFKAVDRLLTNFHLPKSTLLMMISAFAGLDFIKRAYEEAVRQEYRFYSYGDCMLII